MTVIVTVDGNDVVTVRRCDVGQRLDPAADGVGVEADERGAVGDVRGGADLLRADSACSPRTVDRAPRRTPS